MYSSLSIVSRLKEDDIDVDNLPNGFFDHSVFTKSDRPLTDQIYKIAKPKLDVHLALLNQSRSRACLIPSYANLLW